MTGPSIDPVALAAMDAKIDRILALLEGCGYDAFAAPPTASVISLVPLPDHTQAAAPPPLLDPPSCVTSPLGTSATAPAARAASPAPPLARSLSLPSACGFLPTIGASSEAAPHLRPGRIGAPLLSMVAHVLDRQGDLFQPTGRGIVTTPARLQPASSAAVAAELSDVEAKEPETGAASPRQMPRLGPTRPCLTMGNATAASPPPPLGKPDAGQGGGGASRRDGEDNTCEGREAPDGCNFERNRGSCDFERDRTLKTKARVLLGVAGVPASLKTEARANRVGTLLPPLDAASGARSRLSIDGAAKVDPILHLVQDRFGDFRCAGTLPSVADVPASLQMEATFLQAEAHAGRNWTMQRPLFTAAPALVRLGGLLCTGVLSGVAGAVDSDFNLVKGCGGSLLCETLTEGAGDRVICFQDASVQHDVHGKFTPMLGTILQQLGSFTFMQVVVPHCFLLPHKPMDTQVPVTALHVCEKYGDKQASAKVLQKLLLTWCESPSYAALWFPAMYCSVMGTGLEDVEPERQETQHTMEHLELFCILPSRGVLFYDANQATARGRAVLEGWSSDTAGGDGPRPAGPLIRLDLLGKR